MGIHLPPTGESSDPHTAAVTLDIRNALTRAREEHLTPLRFHLQGLAAAFTGHAALATAPSAIEHIESVPARIAGAERYEALAAIAQRTMVVVEQAMAELEAIAQEPLPVMSEEAQLKYWLRRMRTADQQPQVLDVGESHTVTVSPHYILRYQHFFTAVLVEFVMKWEPVIAQFIERTEHLDPEQAKDEARLTSIHSWRLLLDAAPFPLTTEDALTIVVAGQTLNLWELGPTPNDLQYASVTDKSLLPFLFPTDILKGVVNV